MTVQVIVRGNILRCLNQVVNLSIESQIFRSIDFFVENLRLTNLSDNHFEPADFGVINFAEIIEDSYEIKSLEGKYIAMISREGTHHNLVHSHIIRSQQGSVKEGRPVRQSQSKSRHNLHDFFGVVLADFEAKDLKDGMVGLVALPHEEVEQKVVGKGFRIAHNADQL